MFFISTRTILPLLLFLCCQAVYSQPADGNLSLSEILVIGDDPAASVDNLFRDPTGVVTDHRGNIYVTDRDSYSIRVFNETGTFLRRIGRNGKGPGEFLDISTFAIADNRLVVFDGVSQRFTEMSLEGEVINTANARLNDNEYISVQGITAEADSAYLLAAHSMRQLNGHLFHRFNPDFSYAGDSMVRPEELWDMEQEFLRTQARSRNFSMWSRGDHMVVARELYQSRSLLYRWSGKEWQQTVLSGFEPALPSYRLFDPARPSEAPSPKVTYSGPEGQFVARIFNRSLGIFIQDDLILHFFMHTTEADEAEFGADLFNLEGNYLGYNKVDFPMEGSPLHSLDILWMDRQGRLYLSDTREIPVVRVMKIDLNKIDSAD